MSILLRSRSLHPSDRITVSLGVSSMISGSGKTIAQLMNEADLALYTVQGRGKEQGNLLQPRMRHAGHLAPE